MPAEQEEFQKSVRDVLEAVMFENWLRFYFINEGEAAEGEAEPEYKLVVPERGMQKIQELYPTLYPMAAELNGKPITPESSQKAVCTYVSNELEGKAFARGTAPSIVGSKAFQRSMELFNIWVQAYEEKLGESFLEFGMWRKIFDHWRESDQGRDIELKLSMSAPTTMQQ